MTTLSGRINNLTGKAFGRLKVISFIGTNKHNKAIWLCVCECGAVTKVIGAHLNNGNTKSCGCLELEIKTRHGMWRTPEYRAWQDMKHRCYNSTNKHFKDYGGRGITVCNSWLQCFENFFSDMGCRPSDTHSLDRISVDGDYEPGNCRWADKYTQQRNRRDNSFIKTQWGLITIAEACEKTGLSKETICGRMRLGWAEHLLLQQHKYYKKD